MNMEKYYNKIAKENGVNVEQVKKDMQEAIDAAYASPNSYARSIPCKGDKPTPDEFISFVENEISALNGKKSV